MGKEVYQESLQELTARLAVDPAAGLNAAEVARRLEQYGTNTLREKKKQTLLQKVLAQFKDVMVLILVAASIVSGFLGEYIDAGVILAIVVINAVLGVLQEGKAEKAIEALRKMASPQARVLRDGQQTLIPSANLVPGDVVLLDAGDIVPADLRLLASHTLKAEEASLTGESVPVEKDAAAVLTETTQLGDRHNMVFMSTAITYGKGRGIVVGTGSQTAIGNIADKLQDIQEEDTPLQKNLNQLGKWLGIVCLTVSAIVFAQGVIMGGTSMILQMFMTAVSLAVAAIPEGLPAVVTIVLALGMKRMADRHAIVKKLLAVETLGCVDVICSDKTGTLTQNEMTVTRLYAGRKRVDVTGTGYAPTGSLVNPADGKPVELTPALLRLLKIGLLCNDATLRQKDDGSWGILGDPTEGAMVVAAAKAGLDREELLGKLAKVGDLPFDSDRKMMSTFHEGFLEGPLVSLTKGAPDIVLSRCARIMAGSGIVDLTEADRQEILDVNHQLASEALRVLAFAFRPHGDGEMTDAENDMIFVGLMGMIDPARPEARDAITLCRQAGIKTVMITGDYKDTAVAIANDLGLRQPDDGVLMGREIDDLDDAALKKAVETTTVYARVSPEHKVRIVTALRENGHIASMTGDGVNDAMALKRADIGVAMGITGTDVAKGTAEMILTDDNFATIVEAVKEGRVIYSNIRKFVGFLLSCNVGEILVIFLTTLIMGAHFVPLLPIQLLWLNLITDSFPALALGQEKGERDIMNHKPRRPDAPILDRPMILNILMQSIAIFISVFFAYRIGIAVHGYNALGEPNDGAHTYAFATLIMAELFRSFSARSEHRPVLGIGIFGNKTLNKAFLLSVALLLVVIYVPFLDPIFKTIPLQLSDWAVILPFSLIPFAVAEIYKLILTLIDKRKSKA